jgi:predicted NBD/HSP70 family sugar kinase
LCYCGKKGCLETEASGASLIRKFNERIAAGAKSTIQTKNKKTNNISLLNIIDAAKKEDPLCIELMADIGDKIGRGLAILINVFNPELLILGGTLSATGEHLRKPISNALAQYSVSLVNSDTQLKLSKLGEKAGVMGSCLLARNQVLSIQS